MHKEYDDENGMYHTFVQSSSLRARTALLGLLVRQIPICDDAIGLVK